MRVLTIAEAAAFAASARQAGRRVVFTNGVFDLLHPGHVRYLAAARALGDALVVGVNSDRSVRANKGETRPMMPEQRARGDSRGAGVRGRGGDLRRRDAGGHHQTAFSPTSS